MLLNADYDKRARNKYLADEVDYTLSVESIQCLSWDGVKDWRYDRCSVIQSFTSTKVNCRSGTLIVCRSALLGAIKTFMYTLSYVYVGLTNKNMTIIDASSLSW